MSSFPGSPQLMKGALVGIDATSQKASTIKFQYNPMELTRSLQAQTATEGGSRAEILRLKGAPVETISLKIDIDATDQLEEAGGTATTLGIHPQLAALELLVYPSTTRVITNQKLLAVGTIEVIPYAAPFTLFIWGKSRVLPVRLSDFSITEQYFDSNLNPIRAEVSLNLRVLSYNDLPFSHPGNALFIAHQVAKEAFAASAGSGTVSTPASLLFK